MREKVICNNCGIKWVRVTVYGPVSVGNEDIMYNCPACGSNDYRSQEETNHTGG